MRMAKRISLGAGTLAALVAGLVAVTADASPSIASRSPLEPVSTSLVHRVLIYAKEGRKSLTDGRWNLGKAKAKLGLTFSPAETRQLMACTGQIVCWNKGRKTEGSASAVLAPNLLVTAKHVFSKSRRRKVTLGQCTFRSFLHRNIAIPIRIDQDQRKHYFLNNEDFIVVRLKRALKDCDGFALNGTDASLSEGDPVFSATAYQRNMLNRISRKEPVIAKGKIRSVSSGFFGGPPFYYADVDLDEGGSGGAVFALKDGRPVLDDEGRLTLRGILVAVGPRARNNRPYSEERNYTIVVGLEEEFRELVEGKANTVLGVAQAQCLDDVEPKIVVISEPVPELPAPTVTSFLKPEGCSHEAGDAGQAAVSCDKLAEEMRKLQKELKAVAASTRAKRTKGKMHQFKLRNDTACPVCFTYNRCNDYGCWDQTVRASGKSILFAGLSKQAPTIQNPLFCKSGRLLADWRPPRPLIKPLLPPPAPLRNPALTVAVSSVDAAETVFLAAKEKAETQGVWSLTPEDVRGLSLEQISALRGY